MEDCDEVNETLIARQLFPALALVQTFALLQVVEGKETALLCKLRVNLEIENFVTEAQFGKIYREWCWFGVSREQDPHRKSRSLGHLRLTSHMEALPLMH